MSEIKVLRARSSARLIFNVGVEDEEMIDEYVSLVAGLGC